MEDSCRLIVFDWRGTMCGDGIDRKASLSSSPSISSSPIMKFLSTDCDWHPHPRAARWVLVNRIDLPIRERRPVFPGLAP